MHKHHKRHVSLCLSNKPTIVRQKRRRNVITTAGHFTSWLVEMLFFGVLQSIVLGNKELVKNKELVRIFLLLLPSVNYVIFPLVQALTSHDLREQIFSLPLWCKTSCLCLKSQPNEIAEEEVELQAVENGHVIQETHLWKHIPSSTYHKCWNKLLCEFFQENVEK